MCYLLNECHYSKLTLTHMVLLDYHSTSHIIHHIVDLGRDCLYWPYSMDCTSADDITSGLLADVTMMMVTLTANMD